MKHTLFLLFPLMAAAFLSSCAWTEPESEATGPEQTAVEMYGDVMSQEDQQALTPEGVMELLAEGNDNYVRNALTPRDLPGQVRQGAAGQFPSAIVLSCVDSRVPVEYVFDKGIGDLFVARVAGNFVNEDILGSMEFACKVSGSKLIVVMGHESCGAVKSAIADVKLGNITPMLAKIRPAVEAVDYPGDRTAGNAEFVQMVCEKNVENTIAQIRTQSPILKEMEDAGEIRIVGAVYDLDTGQVTFMP